MRISDWSSDVCSSDLDDGGLKTQSHDFWRTIYGPVVMRPGAFGWDARTAYAIRDANFDNNRMIEVWQAMDAAPDLDVFARDIQQILGLPWVNTVAADRQGRALYMGVTVVQIGRAACRERVCQCV